MQKSTLKTAAQKIENRPFLVLKELNPIKKRLGNYSICILEFTTALDDYSWGFNDKDILPGFYDMGSIVSDIASESGISEYQSFCLIKLSKILFEARVLYQNNLIDFSDLYSIVFRVKKDAYKRFKLIEKNHSRKVLNDQNLDKDSLVLLQAKLAILENEN